MTFLAKDSDILIGLTSRNEDFLGDDCNLAPNSSCYFSVIAFLSRFISSNGISMLFETLSHALNFFFEFGTGISRNFLLNLRRNFFSVI